MQRRTRLIIIGVSVGVIILFGILIVVGSLQQGIINVSRGNISTLTQVVAPQPDITSQPIPQRSIDATLPPLLSSSPTAHQEQQTATIVVPAKPPSLVPILQPAVPAIFDDFSIVSSGWSPFYIDKKDYFNGYSAGSYVFNIAHGTQMIYDVRAPLTFVPTRYAVDLRILRGAGEVGLLIGVRGSPEQFASLGYTSIGVTTDGQLIVRSRQSGQSAQVLQQVALADASGATTIIPLEVTFEGTTAHIIVDRSQSIDIPNQVPTTQIGLYAQSTGATFETTIDNLLVTAPGSSQVKPTCGTLRDLFLTRNPKDYLDGVDVLLAQQRMLNLGYNPGKIDGVYGPNTDLAVRNFQQANGITESWMATETWCRLLSGQAITAINALTDRDHTTASYRQIDVDPSAPLSAPMFVSVRQDDRTWRIALLLPGRVTLQYLETEDNAFDPAIAPDHSRIAFTSTRSNGTIGRIWLLDLTTGTLQPISDPQLDSQFPTWSPDGSSLMYTAEQPGATGTAARNYIYQMQRGTATLWLDEHAGWSDWSSLNEIVFTHWTGKSFDLFRANPDGSSLVNLTNSDDADEDISTWSPDGHKIAFVRNARNPTGDRQVMVMDRDGSNMRQITSSPGPNSNPAWLPDSQWLLFANQQDTETRQPRLVNLGTGAIFQLALNRDRIWFMSGLN